MTRWISGIIIAPLIIVLLLKTSREVVQGVCVLVAVIGVREMLQMGRNPRLFHTLAGMVLCGLGSTLMIFWAQSAEHMMSISAGLLAAAFLLNFRGSADFEERFQHTTFFYFSMMYCVLLFSFWGWVRALDHWEFWVFFMLASTFLSDTGAYVFGRWIGKHKLSPLLSPGKTVEGLLGGILFSVAAAFTVRCLFWPEFPTSHLVILSVLTGLIGPLGDLSESLIKRGLHAKDSGHLIPGHGGLLDRVDALLFTAPVVYYYAKYVM